MIRICTNCGRAYSRRDLYCPYCGRTPHRFGRICAKGHHNPRDATFCATCGSQNLSELAPPIPLWRRMVSIFLLVCFLVSLRFLIPSLLSSVLTLALDILARSWHILFMGAICFFAPFAFTLFLPKHMGKYIRKVLFTVVRRSLRLFSFAIVTLWRIVAYFASWTGGTVAGSQRRRR